MRKTLCTLALAFVTTMACAAIDLRDFDADSMRAVDDAAKEIESAIAAQDAQASAANAEFVRDSLRLVEGYFANQGEVEDAVEWAKLAQKSAERIAAAVNGNDFESAYDSLVSLKKTCKSCHDAYKPPSL